MSALPVSKKDRQFRILKKAFWFSKILKQCHSFKREIESMFQIIDKVISIHQYFVPGTIVTLNFRRNSVSDCIVIDC